MKMTCETANGVCSERRYDTAEEAERVARAVRTLVAKTAPDDGQLWLPLLIHLRDTAAVMEYLTAYWLPEQYCVSLGMRRDEFFHLAIRAALLHDIGRLQQYLTGEDHAAAGMRTAQEILRDTAFSASEQQAILQAVSKHRRGDTAQMLGRILCEADDASRMCFACAAQDTCYWPEHRKNNTILL